MKPPLKVRLRAARHILQGKPLMYRITVRSGRVELTDGTALPECVFVDNYIDTVAGQLDLGGPSVRGYIEIMSKAQLT